MDHDEPAGAPKGARRKKPAPAANSGSNEVGYKRPPKEHQFKKGEPSPNPKGRPKGSKAIDPMKRLLDKKIAVKQNGKRIMVPLAEALDMRLIEAALANEPSARREVRRARTEFLKLETKRGPSAEEILEQDRADRQLQELRKEALEWQMEMLDLYATLRVMGILEDMEGGKFKVPEWIKEASRVREAEKQRKLKAEMLR